MTRPLIILGVDGLDWEFVDDHRDALPTLSRWPSLRPLRSIFPPDSIPAWTTIFTGVGPAEHGCLDAIDYLDDAPGKATDDAAQRLPGNTFWDEASRRGLKVCVVNPFMAYPAWDVNGLMVSGPVFVDGTLSVTGAAPDELPEAPELGGIVTFPTRDTIGPFVEETLAETRAQAEFGLELLQRDSVDLFFMNILTIDRLQHFVWRFIDPTDPTYPGPNDHEDSALRGYQAIDEIAARFEEHGHVVILSDHGHGMRCRRMLYVDEVLRRAGLVAVPESPTARLKSYVLERAKKSVLRTVYEIGREEEAYKLARRLPNRKSLKYSSFSSSESRSTARVSRTFGRNQHSGVEVLHDTPENRAAVRRALEAVRDPQTGEGVFEWIHDREDVVDGARIDRYPEILFRMKDGYGVDFGLYGGLFGPDVNHRRISGGHKRDGVFASSAPVDAPASIEEFYDFVVSRFARADSPR
ncbi:MAG TPA: alkaline phosphatase family protein [Capillimicrobium sp.]|nr:alkaline phosphatase family protein [Capillimicrobium sp.]